MFTIPFLARHRSRLWRANYNFQILLASVKVEFVHRFNISQNT